MFQDSLRQSMKEHADTYNRDSQQLRELRLGEDKDILMEGTVIGMTTTGAARYRRVLAAVACPIIILEEAAEVSSSCCYLSVSLSSVSVSVCLSACLSVCLPVPLSSWRRRPRYLLPVVHCLCILSLFACLSARLSVCLPSILSVSLPAVCRPSVMSVCLSACLYHCHPGRGG